MSGKSYSLRDDGYPTFKKIMSGGKWIGRVIPGNGCYHGIIGNTMFRGATEDDAFRGVVARHCGHGNYNEMALKNAKVRQANKRNRAVTQQAVDALISGDFAPFEKLFRKETS
jgi:hypothetical protein